MRDARASIDDAEQDARARSLVAIVEQLPWWTDAQRVAVYRATRGELNPDAVARRARELGKATFTPVLAGDELRFAAFDEDTGWVLNRFGIAEPASATAHCSTAALDLVVVPAVAADRSGHRLGMGGGWYDRTFAFKNRGLAGPALIAAVHDEQLVDEISPAPWDVHMDAVVTPTRSYVR